MNILENVMQDLVLNKTLSIVYNTFLKSSVWRWLRRNEPKHVAVRYDVNIFNNNCVTDTDSFVTLYVL